MRLGPVTPGHRGAGSGGRHRASRATCLRRPA